MAVYVNVKHLRTGKVHAGIRGLCWYDTSCGYDLLNFEAEETLADLTCKRIWDRRKE